MALPGRQSLADVLIQFWSVAVAGTSCGTFLVSPTRVPYLCLSGCSFVAPDAYVRSGGLLGPVVELFWWQYLLFLMILHGLCSLLSMSLFSVRALGWATPTDGATPFDPGRGRRGSLRLRRWITAFCPLEYARVDLKDDESPPGCNFRCCSCLTPPSGWALWHSRYVSSVLFGCMCVLLSWKLIHQHLVSLVVCGFINLNLGTCALCLNKS
jgi:hypothetical protein